jgi:PAS domain S-box-containing protein
MKHEARNTPASERMNKQLETIFSSSSDGLWVCDGEGRIISINKASEKLNGIRAVDYIGKKMTDVITSGFMDRSVTVEVLKSKRKVSLIQHVHATHKELLVTGTPAFDDQGNIDLVVVNERDMTKLNSLNKALAEAQQVGQRYREKINELAQVAAVSKNFIASSAKMKQILQTALKLSLHDVSNILILGESGVGKGVLAKYIHNNSQHKNEAFIHINCASLPEALLEAELFGYEKGAFTGANKDGKVGLFELAKGGTLFLDEIGDLPLSTQAKLLKYLDDKEIRRVGGTHTLKIDCTVIAATNLDLAHLVKKKQFRPDLFHRLNTFTLTIPPLRERHEDILDLVRHYVDKYNRDFGTGKWISMDVYSQLQAYTFPGNVRELKNILKKAVVLGDKDRLDGLILKIMKEEQIVCVQNTERSPGADSRISLKNQLLKMERNILVTAIGQDKTSRKIAKSLGISQTSVMRKIKTHGLTLPKS